MICITLPQVPELIFPLLLVGVRLEKASNNTPLGIKVRKMKRGPTLNYNNIIYAILNHFFSYTYFFFNLSIKPAPINPVKYFNMPFHQHFFVYISYFFIQFVFFSNIVNVRNQINIIKSKYINRSNKETHNLYQNPACIFMHPKNNVLQPFVGKFRIILKCMLHKLLYTEL